jgi:hypothetical protein
MNTVYLNHEKGNDSNKGEYDSPLLSFANVPDNSLVVLQGKYIPVINITGKNNLLILPEGMSVLPAKKLPDDPVLNFTTCGILLTNCKDVKISSVSVSVSYFVPSPTFPKLTNKGITFNNCTSCLLQNSELFSLRDTKGWNEKTWNNMRTGISLNDGVSNQICNNHVFNTGGIQIASGGSFVDGNLFENFPTDGVGIKKYNVTFSNNIVRNTYRVNGNHNDLLQFHPGVQSAAVLNNTFVAYTDPNQPFKDTAVQGVGGYDKTGKLLIKGNTISVDHPIGIWLLGTFESVIDGNTVKRCGSKFWQPSRPSSISIQPSKGGGASIKNTVTNNVSTGYEIQAGSVITQSNNYNSLTKKFVVFP